MHITIRQVVHMLPSVVRSPTSSLHPRQWQIEVMHCNATSSALPVPFCC
jgi:hypothetical protein